MQIHFTIYQISYFLTAKNQSYFPSIWTERKNICSPSKVNSEQLGKRISGKPETKQVRNLYKSITVAQISLLTVTTTEHFVHDPKTTISSSPHVKKIFWKNNNKQKSLYFILYKWEDKGRTPFGRGSLCQAGASSGGPIRELTHHNPGGSKASQIPTSFPYAMP